MKTYIELNRDDKERAKHLKEALDRYEEKKLNPEMQEFYDQDNDPEYIKYLERESK